MECPVNLQREVSKRYLATQVKWCPRTESWWIYADGKKAFALIWEDGLPMGLNGRLDTQRVLDQIARADKRRYTGRELPSIRSAEYEHKRREARAKEYDKACLEKEASDYTRVYTDGPKPFIQLTSNNTSKGN